MVEARKPTSSPLAATLVLALWCGGCTATITPPREVRAPVEVYFLLDDRHRGLILPDEKGELYEYGYGEWWWFAKLQDSWYHGFRALLWPTQGTLGRRRSHARDLASLRKRFYWMQVSTLVVERAKMEVVRAKLRGEYAARSGEQIFNPRYGFHFVPHRDSYWLFHNCNDEVAGWMALLGCDVSWVPLCLGLELADRPAPEARRRP